MKTYEQWEKEMEASLPNGFREKFEKIAIDTIRQQKLCLIEDVFKVLKCLSGFNGDMRFDTKAGEVFEELYSMSITDIEVELATLSAKLKRHAWNLTTTP